MSPRDKGLGDSVLWLYRGPHCTAVHGKRVAKQLNCLPSTLQPIGKLARGSSTTGSSENTWAEDMAQWGKEEDLEEDVGWEME